MEIVDALKQLGYRTRIAQHGITGTPIDIIASTFPHGSVTKGNIGTYWQLLVFEILEKLEPTLYNKMKKWIFDKYGKPGVNETIIFEKNSKYAWKEFFDEVENISNTTKEAIIVKAEKDMNDFITALKMENTASFCFKYMSENNLFNKY